VEGYDQMKGRDCRRLGRPDPLAAGQINAHEPIWMPREYFLKVFQVRMHQVLREWNNIADKVDEEVKQYVQCVQLIDSCSFCSPSLLSLAFAITQHRCISRINLESQP
jgi:hypothetical protein